MLLHLHVYTHVYCTCIYCHPYILQHFNEYFTLAYMYTAPFVSPSPLLFLPPSPSLTHTLLNFPLSLSLSQVCFYKHGKKGEISIGPKRSFICKLCNGVWECVVVIPSSTLCWNFGDFDLLPVAPWPRSKPSQTPFEYCRKDDHYRYGYTCTRICT